MNTPVDALLNAISTATVDCFPGFAPDACLDATVPNWRFSLQGATAVAAELSRTPLPSGELVQFTLAWEEGGVPHAAHQVHVITVASGKISDDRVWCGGRWPASLLAEMEAAGG